MRCEFDGSLMTVIDETPSETVWRCPWCKTLERETTTRRLLQREWDGAA